MKPKFRLLVIIILFSGTTFAQLGIGVSTIPKYSIVEINFAKKLGLSLPKMTSSQRDNLVVSGNSKADGLMIFNTTSNNIEYYSGGSWIEVVDSPASGYSLSSSTGTITTSTGATISDVDVNVKKNGGASDNLGDGIPIANMGSLSTDDSDTSKVFFEDSLGVVSLAAPDSLIASKMILTDGLSFSSDYKIGLGSVTNPAKFTSDSTEMDLNGYDLSITSMDKDAVFTAGGSAANPVFSVKLPKLSDGILSANVGINTATPRVSLDVNGALSSFEYAYDVNANGVDIPSAVTSDYAQISLVNSTSDFTFTLGTPANAGVGLSQKIFITNNTSFDAYYTNGNKINLFSPGDTREFSYSPTTNAWVFIGPTTSVTSIYFGTLIIPREDSQVGTFDSAQYNSSDWKLIEIVKNVASNPSTNTFSAKVLVYEYVGNQGTLGRSQFNLSTLRTYLSPNVTNSLIAFTATVSNIQNISGTTRVTIILTRGDFATKDTTKGSWNAHFGNMSIIMMNVAN